MIEGIKLDVTAKELKFHLLKRADFHLAVAQDQEKKLALVKDEVEVEESKQDMLAAYGSQTARSVQGSLRAAIASHHQKHQLFKFMADHVVEGETYRVDEKDLARIEMMDHYWG